MTKGLSLYLDVIRFLAALVVFISHSSGRYVTGAFLWPIAPYASTAVMVFFVLSGYVIAYVVYNKEHHVTDFAIARFSRLYSVIIPALLLTLVCNVLGDFLVKDGFLGVWNHDEPYTYWRYLITTLMAQDLWSVSLSPTNNGSFWSISYEFSYYVLFACFYFIRHRVMKYVALVVCSLIVGPAIIVLAPIWGLGYFAYLLHQKKYVISLPLYWHLILWTVGLGMLLLSGVVRPYFPPWIGRESIVGNYWDGLAFFLHLVSAPYVMRYLTWLLERFSTWIRFCSSLTFALYLFHLPLVRLFSGISPYMADPGSLENRLFIFIPTLCVVIFLGLPCEQLKRVISRRLKIWAGVKKSDNAR